MSEVSEIRQMTPEVRCKQLMLYPRAVGSGTYFLRGYLIAFKRCIQTACEQKGLVEARQSRFVGTILFPVTPWILYFLIYMFITINGVFLTLKQVLKLYPVSRSTWYAGVKSGRYPKPVKIGLRRVAWLRADIEQLIASRVGID